MTLELRPHCHDRFTLGDSELMAYTQTVIETKIDSALVATI